MLRLELLNVKADREPELGRLVRLYDVVAYLMRHVGAIQDVIGQTPERIIRR